MRTKAELKSALDDLESQIDDLRWELKEKDADNDDCYIDPQTAVDFMFKFDDFTRRVGLSKINVDVVLFRKDLEDLLDVRT